MGVRFRRKHNQSCKENLAYNLADGSRVPSKDFDKLQAAGNDRPHGIWSDGETTWVADKIDNKIYAYKMSDKSRDSSKDFNPLADAKDEDK